MRIGTAKCGGLVERAEEMSMGAKDDTGELGRGRVSDRF